jgi:hypothetical protein
MPASTATPRLDLEPVIERAQSDANAGCECSPDGGFWRLRIWGWFPPDWCGNLSLHCYAARLSVLGAEARRVRTSLWAGVFLLEPSARGASPRAHDFVHMARHRPTGVAKPVAISIESLRVEPGAGGRAARIHVGGPDRIGFLAAVLERMAFCGLHPHELSVRTTADGRAEDRFEVHGVGGAPPTPAALEAALKQLRG